MAINSKYLEGETGQTLGRYLVEAIERQVNIATKYPEDPDVQKSTTHAISQGISSWIKLRDSVVGQSEASTDGLNDFLESMEG